MVQPTEFSNKQIQSPPKQFSFTIPAGAIETIYYELNFLRILSLSDASALKIRFGDTGTETDVVGAGVGYAWPYTVSNVFLRNTSGAPITVTVAVAVGQIFDDRLNVSGNINVVNAPATVLDVEDAPVLAMMQNDEAQRTPLTTLQGATIANVLNATTTIVTGAANVNGVIIRSINLYSGSNVTSYLQIGAVRLLQTGYVAGGCDSVTAFDIFVPAGNQIIVSGGNTVSGGNIAYEVL